MGLIVIYSVMLQMLLFIGVIISDVCDYEDFNFFCLVMIVLIGIVNLFIIDFC